MCNTVLLIHQKSTEETKAARPKFLGLYSSSSVTVCSYPDMMKPVIPSSINTRLALGSNEEDSCWGIRTAKVSRDDYTKTTVLEKQKKKRFRDVIPTRFPKLENASLILKN
uniref:Uncharacterized protein n=1 Tax=Acrobeloides nanus TaxID=290746 RepID=A0A914CCV0_9BILA